MTQPTPAEQLLNLADRAALTGAETARLREGITELYGLFEQYRDRSNEYADRYLKQRERAERAEAERDEARAAIERVRALADDIDTPTWRAPGTEVAARIRVALDEHQEQRP